MKIVVIGGTGLIGSKLVTRLREMGNAVIAASPNSGVNTLTGEGLADALAGYFRAKLVQENLIKSSPIAYTILHSTQFFEFIGRIAQESADGKSVRVAAAFIQPIVSDDVVEALAELTVGAPGTTVGRRSRARGPRSRSAP